MRVVSLTGFALACLSLVNWTNSAAISGKIGLFHDQDPEMYYDDGPESGNKPEHEGVTDHIIQVNENAGLHLLEGDIVAGPEVSDLSAVSKRELRRGQHYLWHSRIVPYEITSDLEDAKELIRDSLNEISKKSCVKFVEKTNEKNWVKFVQRSGCWSSVGRNFWSEGAQEISIGSGCRNKGTIQHEALHALGFWHEQSRNDRDRYVEIFWENIESGKASNFAKLSLGESTSLESPYDYESIMHYGRTSFSKNKKPTMQVIGDPNKPLGQRDGLSAADILQLDELYRCKEVGAPTTSWTDWSPCDYRCEKERTRFCSRIDGEKCDGFDTWGIKRESKQCTDQECYKPLDGHWNIWSSWSSCSKTCGPGVRMRTRECTDPLPKNGGQGCQGDGKEALSCEIVSCSAGKDDCLFDGQVMCYWKDVSDGSYKWSRIKGKTPSSRTGPSGDESLNGKGYYMYAEASSTTPGMKATLESRLFSKTSRERTLMFHYSMYGGGIGSLKVLIQPLKGARRIIWERVGDQGEGWKEATVPLTSDVEYKVIFQATRGPNFQGDIAIDSILFMKPSPPLTTTPATTTATTTTRRTTTTATTTPNKMSGFNGAEPLGCLYRDTSSLEPSKLLLNMRNNIEWKPSGFKKFVETLLTECKEKAKDKGYTYFSIRYYGECWSYAGKEPQAVKDMAKNYNGKKPACITGDGTYKNCGEPGGVCVGKDKTEYVYFVQ